MFSPNPGFPQQNRGFIANPSFFRGLEGQGIYIYSIYSIYFFFQELYWKILQQLLQPYNILIYVFHHLH